MGPESAFRAPHSKDMIRTALSISKAGFFRVRFQRRGGPLKGTGESQAPRAIEYDEQSSKMYVAKVR